MGNFFQDVLDWSEVWAAALVVIMLLWKPQQPSILKPVIWYAWLALILNVLIDVNARWKSLFPDWFQSNNAVYNIHSVVRFICFSIFFLQLHRPAYRSLKKVLIGVWVLFLIIHFGFYQDFFSFNELSGYLFATEGFLLLVFCMLYYLSELKYENQVSDSGPVFWVVTGLSIYVVINFFVFLFYGWVVNTDPDLAERLWNIHNIAFIILCIFLTKAFYGTTGNKHRLQDTDR